MTFLEQELRKIVGSICPDATFVPRACYVELSELNRAKIQLDNSTHSDHYSGIRVTVLNQNIGQLDEMNLSFKDLWGTKLVNSPNFPSGVNPHIWNYKGQPQWYVYQPTASDYSKLQRYLLDYLKVFDYQKDRKLSLDAQIAEAAPKAKQTGERSMEMVLNASDRR